MFDIISMQKSATMAQLAEHVIGNDEVPGPNPGSSSKKSATSRLLIFYPSRRHGGLVCNHAAGVYVINAPRALYVITALPCMLSAACGCM